MDFRTMLKKKKYAKNVIAEDDPDWGNLKKVERPEAEPEPDDKPVRSLVILRTFLSARTELRALLVFPFCYAYLWIHNELLLVYENNQCFLTIRHYSDSNWRIFPQYTEVKKKFGGWRNPGTKTSTDFEKG